MAAMGVVAFLESSFFPIPPDVMLIPMALSDRKRAFLLGGWCALWSVIGGCFGYAIGALLYHSVGQWLINAYGMGGELEAFRVVYAKYGPLIVLQGLTPIPYKLVTISAGFAGLDLPLFILLSVVTRGARFSLVAAAIYFFGAPVQAFIEKWLELALFLFLAAVVAGFLIVHYVF
jgi:membrane protein YqaA with SNARE-associated domain